MRYPLRRRYGHARERKIRYFRVLAGRLGPTAVAYDSQGRSVNVINGVWGQDTVESVRRAALKHWPEARDRTPQ